MKKIILLIILILNVFLTNAQRSFYIENGKAGENYLKDDLLKATQFIARSPFMSDCIIKTESFQKKSKGTSVKITLEDSATFKTIFQVTEEYSYKNLLRSNSQVFLNLAMKTLIEKYIKQIIFYAELNNRNTLMLLLKEKKDKT